MTKSIKNLLLVVLSALLVFSSVILLLPTSTAKAEKLKDDNNIFEIYSGAQFTLQDTTATEITKENITLDFSIALNNTNYADLNTRLGIITYNKTLGGTAVKDFYYDHYFTLCRVNHDGTTTNVSEMVISYYPISVNFTPHLVRSILTKNLSYSNDAFDVEGIINRNACFSYGEDLGHVYYPSRFGDNFSGFCWDINYYNDYSEAWLFSDNFGTPTFNISVKPQSLYNQYYIDYRYDYKEFDYKPFIGNPVYSQVSGTMESSHRSVCSILERMNEAGTLNTLPNTSLINSANAIIDSGLEENKVDVMIQWLVPIDGTPFATEKREKAKIPLNKEKIDLEDVYSALSVDSLDCFTCHVKGLKKVNDVYVAQYYKSSWLKVVTPGGETLDYFNDINLSYYDYYYQYVKSKLFTEEVYEFMYSCLLTKYPNLKTYQTSPEKVYGLWGMAVVPKDYTIDSLWANVFGTDATKGEHVTNFSFTKLMTSDEYNALLKSYEYTWLKTAWNNVAGFFEGMYATHYLFFMEPNTQVSWIDQSGQIEDEDDAKEPNQSGAVGSFMSGLFQDVGEVFNNVWDLVVGTLKKPVGLSSVLVIVCAGIVVFVLLNKSGGKSGGKRRK